MSRPISPADRPVALIIVFPLMLGAMVLALQLRPVHDVDIFWQIQLGGLALDRGGLVPGEPFSATHAGEPLVPVAWLGQVVLAALFRMGGWPLLRAVDATLWALAFVIAGRSAVRSPSTTGAAAVAVGLGFVAALPFASLRPQTFAVLAFGVFLATLRSGQPLARKLVLAAVVLVVWQNLHPSVTVAVAAAGGAAAGGWARWAVRREGRKPVGETVAMVLAAGANLATPAGPRLFEVSAYNAEICREFGVSEWLPIWVQANRAASVSAWAAVAATVILAVRGRRRVRAEDVGAAGVLTILMFAALRFAPFWAIAMIPVWVSLLAPAPATTEESPTPRRRRFASAVVAGLLVALAVGTAEIVRPRQFAEYLPLEAAIDLKQAGVNGAVFCHPGWGGPLIGTGYPEWRVAYDGRYYVYTRAEWDFYFAAARGDVTLIEMDHRYRPAAYFLHPTAEAGLIDRLRYDAGWTEIHSDANAVVYVRSRTSGRRP